MSKNWHTSCAPSFGWWLRRTTHARRILMNGPPDVVSFFGGEILLVGETFFLEMSQQSWPHTHILIRWRERQLIACAAARLSSFPFFSYSARCMCRLVSCVCVCLLGNVYNNNKFTVYKNEKKKRVEKKRVKKPKKNIWMNAHFWVERTTTQHYTLWSLFYFLFFCLFHVGPVISNLDSTNNNRHKKPISLSHTETGHPFWLGLELCDSIAL